jgi:drug/metabolite transporter (DMT)-like permease
MDESAKGDFFILSQTILWSLFPIFTILSFSSLGPLYSASISTFFAAVFFAVTITIKKSWTEVFNKKSLKNILLATFFIGIIYYSLIFLGYNYTTAGNGSIASLMEIFFAFFILGIMGKEKITTKRIIGAVLMCSGAILVLSPKASGIRLGDFIIVIATMFPALGNYFMQKARKQVSSITIMFIRSIVSSVFIFMFAMIFSEVPSRSQIISSLVYLVPSGFLFLGLSKIMWIEGIHRIPITKANSLSTITPLFTLIFSFLILKEPITAFQVMGALPIIIGANIILKKDK